MLFPNFEHKRIPVDGVTINVVHSGVGPPVLLLHGYPQTHVMWHHVAPVLAKHYTVVCPDLRGYGDSDVPQSDREHAPYGKRAMARDQVGVMSALGFERFSVVGHDRGARVAHRMALDHSERVTRLALLDIVPTKTVFENISRVVATGYYHWFMMLQPELPERLIGAAAEFYVRWSLDRWGGTPDALTDEAVAEYVRCFDAATIHATCEDYRAGAGIDLEHDRGDIERKIACPLLVLYGRGLGALYDVPSVWRERATDVRGTAMDCGHFIAEERPDETAAELLAFLAE